MSCALPDQVRPLTRELVARAHAIDALARLYCAEYETKEGTLGLRLDRLAEFEAAALAEFDFALDDAFTTNELAAVIGTAHPPLEAFEEVVVRRDMGEGLASLGASLGSACRLSASNPVCTEYPLKHYANVFEMIDDVTTCVETHNLLIPYTTDVCMFVCASAIKKYSQRKFDRVIFRGFSLYDMGERAQDQFICLLTNITCRYLSCWYMINPSWDCLQRIPFKNVSHEITFGMCFIHDDILKSMVEHLLANQWEYLPSGGPYEFLIEFRRVMQ